MYPYIFPKCIAITTAQCTYHGIRVAHFRPVGSRTYPETLGFVFELSKLQKNLEICAAAGQKWPLKLVSLLPNRTMDQS